MVEERHKPLPSGKGLVDEKVFLIVAHGIAKVNGFDRPTVTFQFVDYPPTQILFVDSIVGVESGGIVIVDDGLVAVVTIVGTEIVNESGYLPLELDVERLYNI